MSNYGGHFVAGSYRTEAMLEVLRRLILPPSTRHQLGHFTFRPQDAASSIFALADAMPLVVHAYDFVLLDSNAN